jgi:2-methylcitrate dehydratase PrpD
MQTIDAGAVTATLVDRAIALRRGDLPGEVATLARQCLLDLLGVTLAGHAEPLPRLMLADLQAQGAGDRATVIGGGERLGTRQAALVNGCAAHALDYDDVNLFISGHPSAVILPALLALGEELDASGADLFMAFLAGYEFACRTGVLVAPGHYLRGYHATASVGAIGAAMACARLLGLDPARSAHAVGIAATEAAGLKSMFGTPCKALHAGLAARNGVESALWAQQGLASRTDVLECRQGFAQTLSPDFHPEQALAQPERFYLRENLFKYHAACYGTHSAIECALQLRRQYGLAAREIGSVVIRVERGADGTCNIASPRTSAEAKFSLRFAVALAFIGHDTGDIANYSEHTTQLPELIGLRDHTTVELMDGWALMDTEVEVVCRDGRRLRARFDTGQPCTDLALQEQRLAAKFATLVGPMLGADRSGELAAAVGAIETISVRDLMRLCRPADQMRRMVDWAFSPAARDIPDAARRKAALVLADNMAAIVAAQDEPEVARVHGQLSTGRSGKATVLRAGLPRTDRISAALANGIAGSWCELDEGYRLAPCHAGLYVIPALLAEAEVLGLSTGELVDAMALSYELTARMARCWIFPQMTLHPHPQTAAIGGAMAVAVCRRFDAATAFQALTSSSTLVTAGDYSHAVNGALVRNVWSAVGTTNGMRAADWARLGIGGMPDGPYSVFTELLGQPPAPQALTQGLGQEWAVANGYHKIHACCQSTHSAVEATLDAIRALPPGATHADIEDIHLHTHRPTMSNKEPGTSLAGKFSFDHVLATTLVNGHAGAPAFSAQTLDDPAIARLRRCVRLSKFEPVPPRPHDRPARVTLRLKDGRHVTAECLSARGGPDRPFEPEVIRGKIDSLMSAALPRLSGHLLSICDLSPSLLARRWADVLADDLC